MLAPGPRAPARVRRAPRSVPRRTSAGGSVASPSRRPDRPGGRLEVGGVGVPAADHERDPLIRLRHVGAGQEGGERAAAPGSASTRHLVPEARRGARMISLVGHEDHPVDVPLGDREPDHAGAPRAERIGGDPSDLHVDRLARGERRRQRRRRSGSTPIARTSLANHAAIPPISPPPPTATITVSSDGTCSVELPRERALSGDDGWLVVRVQERRAGVDRPAPRRPRRPRRRSRRPRAPSPRRSGSARSSSAARSTGRRSRPDARDVRPRMRRPARSSRPTRRAPPCRRCRPVSIRLNAPRGLKEPVCCSSSSLSTSRPGHAERPGFELEHRAFDGCTERSLGGRLHVEPGHIEWLVAGGEGPTWVCNHAVPPQVIGCRATWRLRSFDASGRRSYRSDPNDRLEAGRREGADHERAHGRSRASRSPPTTGSAASASHRPTRFEDVSPIDERRHRERRARRSGRSARRPSPPRATPSKAGVGPRPRNERQSCTGSRTASRRGSPSSPRSRLGTTARCCARRALRDAAGGAQLPVLRGPARSRSMGARTPRSTATRSASRGTRRASRP